MLVDLERKEKTNYVHHTYHYRTVVWYLVLTEDDGGQQSDGSVGRSAAWKKRLRDVIGESQAHYSVSGRPAN